MLSVTLIIKELNYLGKGIQLDTNLTLSDDEIKGKFSVINPNFKKFLTTKDISPSQKFFEE